MHWVVQSTQNLACVKKSLRSRPKGTKGPLGLCDKFEQYVIFCCPYLGSQWELSAARWRGYGTQVMLRMLRVASRQLRPWHGQMAMTTYTGRDTELAVPAQSQSFGLC